MIQNLILALGVAAATITPINIETNHPQNSPEVESREIIYEVDEVYQDLNLNSIYYFGEQQHQRTQYYDIDTVWLKYVFDTNQYYLSFYTVITPLTEDRPSQNLLFKNEFTITGEENCTLYTRKAYQQNVQNRDDIYLDLENLKENADNYQELMQSSSYTWSEWNTKRIDYNYFIEQIDRTDSINTNTTMDDGKIRYSAVYQIQVDADEINLRPETTTIEYYYYVQPVEVVDIGGLMWQILGMPFSFISQAFNLTVFPDTPYSVNISNLLFTIIGALLLIIVVKKVIK